MALKQVTDATFKKSVQNEGLTVVNFWAPWCGPCKMFAPVLEVYDLEQRDDVRILKINVDKNEKIASFFRVMSLPTTILFKDGKPIDKKIGFLPKEALAGWISANK
ncbi:thioredoxin [Shimazuella kribbensis]|uniref:thioredoxin n=1 Tax=Shimazuella kribbensis TaxID=139808 RepID=UPI0004011A48|nr:thioredoxin [Shimazuella kribbensis]